MGRTILHSDCNCFYASVEMLHHPETRNVPMAVGGDPEARHGIVLTANYIAKRMGVKTGMALWQARQVCPQIVAWRCGRQDRCARRLSSYHRTMTSISGFPGTPGRSILRLPICRSHLAWMSAGWM